MWCVLIAYLGLSTIWDGSPRTIQFQIDDWQNQSWGLHNIDRRRIRCEVAAASDGSRLNRNRENELFKHYFVPNGHGDGAQSIFAFCEFRIPHR